MWPFFGRQNPFAGVLAEGGSRAGAGCWRSCFQVENFFFNKTFSLANIRGEAKMGHFDKFSSTIHHSLENNKSSATLLRVVVY